MLFFFGTGTSLIGNYQLEGVACVNCGTRNAVTLTIYSSYLHVFWIPLIPLGKNSVSQCAHCQQVLKTAQMPPAYREQAQALQHGARTPITNYLALSIVGVLFVGILVVGALGSRKPAGSRQLARSAAATPATAAPADTPTEADPAANEALLAAPQVADLYVMRNPDRRYSIMRVARVVPDTVYLQTSTYRPKSLADVSAQADSVQRGLNTFLVPMPRTNVKALNNTKLLTVLRK